MNPSGRFCGKENLDLINYLKRSGIITSDKVYNTMCKVDRGNYTLCENAYMDSPQSIGFGATISAPHMHAYALEYLSEKLQKGSKALDVGSGSGYLTTCMGLMVGPQGIVVGVEHISQLQEIAKNNIERDQPELLKTGCIELIVGDGRLGYSPKAPYDVIHVGAAALEIPEKLISHLAPGGRMIIPVGKKKSEQVLFQIDKTADGVIKKNKLLDVIYVPLTDKEHQVNL